MKRVLYIASQVNFPWRGTCLRVGHEVEALTRLGYQVDLLTLPVGSPPAIPGVRTLTVPRLPFCRNLPEGPSIRKAVFDLMLLIRALALAWRHRYAVVQGVDDAGPAAWLAGRMARGAVVFEQHEDRAAGPARGWRRPVGRLYRAAERAVLRRADAVIAVDPEIRAYLRGTGREGRICLIADIPGVLEPVAPGARADARSRLAPRADTILVTYTGSLARFQGLDLLFNAMPAVQAGDPHVRFVIVGGSAGEIERQRQVLERAGLGASVTFLGRIPPLELAAVLAASDILVAPRISGRCPPMKVLDYLQSGAAIVAADCAANRVILSAYVAVLTLPRADALAEGILRLCRDPAQRAELGRHGRERVRSSCSFEGFQESLRRCYEYVGLRH